MSKSNEQKRLEAARADKRALASEAAKSSNSATRREGERQTQEAKGISNELKHMRGNDPGKKKT